MIGSWIFGEAKEDDNKQEGESNAGDTSESAPAPPSQTLTAEELRKRRLNNSQLMSTTTKATQEDTSNTAGSDTTASTSPKRANITIEHNNTTPQDKKKTKPPSSPLTTDSMTLSSPKTSTLGAKLDRHARTLNLALEFIFQITVRPDNARANIKFVDTEGESDFLNVDNLEYLLPMRLMEVVQEGVMGPQQGSPCYLIRTYKRLVEKESQLLKEDPMLKDLQR
jgi:hypothetical protein